MLGLIFNQTCKFKNQRRFPLNISAALVLTNFSVFFDFGVIWSVQGLRLPVASQRAAMRAQMSFVILELQLRPKQGSGSDNICLQGMVIFIWIKYCDIFMKYMKSCPDKYKSL